MKELGIDAGRYKTRQADEKSSNGYLKGFAISQNKKDIKLAFDYVKNKTEKQTDFKKLGKLPFNLFKG
ncbi:hypothetical protein [Methyloprofundus sp.]|uniref:hypothetical protein n=1 Tax=Methyloprofundus sp. TaxID=2020875 RepID=UPI003D1231A7